MNFILGFTDQKMVHSNSGLFVYEASHVDSGRKVILKIIESIELEKMKIKHFKNEYEILNRLEMHTAIRSVIDLLDSGRILVLVNILNIHL